VPRRGHGATVFRDADSDGACRFDDQRSQPRAMVIPAQIAAVTRHQGRRTLGGYIQGGQPPLARVL
jgi:hypothetical protein